MVLALTTTSCGDDNTKTDDDHAESTADFCAAVKDFKKLINKTIETQAEITRGMRTARTFLDEMDASAPEEVAADVETYVQAWRDHLLVLEKRVIPSDRGGLSEVARNRHNAAAYLAARKAFRGKRDAIKASREFAKRECGVAPPVG